MEEQNRQASKTSERAREKPAEKKSSVCKKCHAPLEEGNLFCTECGEKIDGEEKICPVCSYSSSSEYCPNCGYKLIATICPKCGTESHDDFCENCGEILSDQLRKEIALKKRSENIVVKKAPPELVQKFFQEQKSKARSAEKAEFIKKMQEHKILMEERGYFNNRENRIIQKFGINLFGAKLLDPLDTAYASKIYEGLSKNMIERQTKLENEELQRLFPDIYKKQQDEEAFQKEVEDKLQAELSAKLAELESKYEDMLKSTTEEFNISYENEQERIRRQKEEEERRRRELEEQRRREEERIRRELEEQRRKEEEERKRREAEYERLRQRQIERRSIGYYMCQYNVHFIQIDSCEDGLAEGTYGTCDMDDVASFSGRITGKSFFFEADYVISGNPENYIQGTFSGKGNLLESSGMCSEPLFFKF
jgi:hypothetical protein